MTPNLKSPHFEKVQLQQTTITKSTHHASHKHKLLSNTPKPQTVMDQSTSSLDQNVDISKLSQKDKQELQQFIVNESQKARIQQCTTSPTYTHANLNPSALIWLLSARACLGFGNQCVLRRGLLTICFCSRSQPNGYLLEEMRNGNDSKRQVG